jgi:hypothetical protein
MQISGDRLYVELVLRILHVLIVVPNCPLLRIGKNVECSVL